MRYVLPARAAPPPAAKAPGPLRAWPGAVRRLALPAEGTARQVDIHSHLVRGLEVPQGQIVATLRLLAADGTSATVPLRAGVETAEWSLDRPGARAGHGKAGVSRSWSLPEGYEGHTYRASVELPRGLRLAQLLLEGGTGPGCAGGGALVRGRPRGLAAGSRARAVPSDDRRAVRERARHAAGLPRPAGASGARRADARAASRPRTRRGSVDDGAPAARLHSGASDRRSAPAAGPRRLVCARARRAGDRDAGARGPRAQRHVRPRWRAWDNGQPVPIARGDHALRAVFLSGGRHRVDFRFRQPSVFVGLAITLATLGALGAAWIVTGRRRPRD